MVPCDNMVPTVARFRSALRLAKKETLLYNLVVGEVNNVPEVDTLLDIKSDTVVRSVEEPSLDLRLEVIKPLQEPGTRPGT